MKRPAIKNEVDVIFTGLLRNKELLMKSIIDLVKLRKAGYVNKIILSTWDYEVEKNLELIKFLKEKEVVIIGSKEPDEMGFGHINCQMKALEVALEKMDKGAFILKTRTDIYINPDFLRKLFAEKENILKINKDLPNGNIFKYKFWIPYFEITKPFYLSDEAYFGYYDDHKLLINYRSYRETYNLQSGTIHMQRWMEPFLDKYSVFRNFLENHPHVGYPKENLFYKGIKKIAKQNKLTFQMLNSITLKNRFRVLEKRMMEKRYIDVLAAYYSILYSHFYVNARPVDYSVNKEGIFRRGSPFNPKVNDSDLTRNYRMENATGKRQGQIYAYSEEFLRNIFEGKIKKKDYFSTNLLESTNKFFNENIA